MPVGHFVYRPPSAMTSNRRSLEDSPADQERQRFRLDALLEAHLRDAESLREWGVLSPQRDVPSISVDSAEAARNAARLLRTYMGLARGPLPAMADTAEQAGLYLLAVDAEGEGSTLTPEAGFGVSVVGGRADPGRRRFTAAHEIGHHLLGDEYQSDAGVACSRDAREHLIDVFAGELLMPERDVVAAWSSGAGDDWERLLTVAADYRVSWAVAVRSAEAAGLLTAEHARTLRTRTPQRGDFLAVTGAAPEPDLPPGTTGPRWRRAVLHAFRTNKITKPRAVQMLHGALSEDELPAVDEPAP